jgi:hypothetical protein
MRLPLEGSSGQLSLPMSPLTTLRISASVRPASDALRSRSYPPENTMGKPNLEIVAAWTLGPAIPTARREET